MADEQAPVETPQPAAEPMTEASQVEAPVSPPPPTNQPKPAPPPAATVVANAPTERELELERERGELESELEEERGRRSRTEQEKIDRERRIAELEDELHRLKEAGLKPEPRSKSKPARKSNWGTVLDEED